MEHKFTESYKVNFEKLEKRILDAKYDEESKDMVNNLVNKTLIVCTGGSKVVGNYLKLCLENKNIIATVIEPRDYFYMDSVMSYKNLVIISNSMKSNGLLNILESFWGEKYIITGSDKEFYANNIRYEIEDKEKSFISLANTLVPMKLILESSVHENSNSLIKEMLLNARKLVQNINYNFVEDSIIQVMTGYDTTASCSALESSLVETGASSVTIHDKGSFCHGRSNLIFRYKHSPIVFLGSVKCEFNNVLKEALCEYNVLDFSNVMYDNKLIEEFYKVICMYYLSLKVCLDKSIDMTMPDYDQKLVKKLYNYRGEM